MRISDWSSDVCSSDLVQGGAEEDQCVTRRYRRNDRVRFGKDGNVLVEVACRPQPRADVLARERGQRPHNVDEIFEVALGPLPNVLVTMRQLRKGTGGDFDGLGQVGCDPLATWKQQLLDKLQ